MEEVTVEVLCVSQIKSLAPLLKAQRALLHISYPEELLLPFTHIGGFEAVFAGDNELDLAAYDARFPRIQDRDFKLLMALSRLLFPTQLSQSARAAYESLVKSRYKPSMMLLAGGAFSGFTLREEALISVLAIKKPDAFLKKELLLKAVECRQDWLTAFLLNGSLSFEKPDLLLLHQRLHRILGHEALMKRPESVDSLAADISVSYLIDSWFGPYSLFLARKRDAVYSVFLRAGVSMSLVPVRDYLKVHPDFYREISPSLFYLDDHDLWGGKEIEAPAFKEDDGAFFEEINRLLRTSGAGSGAASGGFFGRGAGNTEEKADIRKREGNDYKDFLREFMVFREDRLLDLDSFDPVYYTLGLCRYGDVPLIEPLEMKEVNRLSELVFVIDTSGSCQGKLVRFFLEETWSVFSDQENFFDHFHIRILQCDSIVQEDEKLTSLSQVDDYMENLMIRGGGNTDFRAAFHYIRDLQKKGELKHLKGIVYFTDGLGTYPETPPAETAAFVFLGEKFKEVQVPHWAKKLLIPLPEGKEWELEYTGGFKANI